LTRRAAIPRGVWVLGGVSLCMDMSSELVHALLPLYMATVLGASALVIGIVEGIAESLALVVKLFSGALSDWSRKRKARKRRFNGWRTAFPACSCRSLWSSRR